MTQPSAHGFPDWGRFAPEADKLYAEFSVPDIDALTYYGPYFVGDVRRVALEFGSAAGPFHVALQYAQNEAMTQAMRTVSVDCAGGMLAYLTYPVLGPWLRIRVIPNAANQSWTGKLYSTSAATLAYAGGGNTSVLISVLNVAIGAGATSTTTAPYVWPGRASWSVFSTLATWTTFLEALSYTGAATRLDTCDNTNGKFSRQLYLPYQSVRSSFTNTTAGAGTYTLALTADAIGGGS